jgi:hypothetical protein
MECLVSSVEWETEDGPLEPKHVVYYVSVIIHSLK